MTAVDRTPNATVEAMPRVHRVAQSIRNRRRTNATWPTHADDDDGRRTAFETCEHVPGRANGADLLSHHQHREYRASKEVGTLRINVSRDIRNDEVKPPHRSRQDGRYRVGQ